MKYALIKHAAQMSQEMESVTQVYILYEAICISFDANALGKGMKYLYPF